MSTDLVRLTPSLYSELARLAVPWCAGLYPRPIPIERVREALVSTGIYLACAADGTLRYVGMAVRRADAVGVGGRVREHKVSRRAEWDRVWIVPLRPDTPRSVARSIESLFIRMLRPTDNIDLSRPHRDDPGW